MGGLVMAHGKRGRKGKDDDPGDNPHRGENRIANHADKIKADLHFGIVRSDLVIAPNRLCG